MDLIPQRNTILNNSVLRFVLVALSLSALPFTEVQALEPPANIRLEGNELKWDPVPGANEYHLYYFDGPVPSSTVLGNYLINTGGTSWPLEAFNAPFGYYTVVSVQTFGQPVPVEYSAITAGEIVAYLEAPPDNAVRSVLLSSGQLQSYYPGDDGDRQAGAQANTQRFVINGDGTFTDTLTQLIWIADSACIPLTDWIGAVDHANGLTADGGSSCSSLQDGSISGDWRLANIVELQSLYDYGLSGAIGDVPLTDVGAVIGDDFWSSTSFRSAPTPNDIGLAWEVKYLSDPDAGSHVEQKLNLGRAWAVRDR